MNYENDQIQDYLWPWFGKGMYKKKICRNCKKIVDETTLYKEKTKLIILKEIELEKIANDEFERVANNEYYR